MGQLSVKHLVWLSGYEREEMVGGPDEETWKNMSPLARRIYWAGVAIVFSLLGGAALYKLLH